MKKPSIWEENIALLESLPCGARVRVDGEVFLKLDYSDHRDLMDYFVHYRTGTLCRPSAIAPRSYGQMEVRVDKDKPVKGSSQQLGQSKPKGHG